MNEAARLRPDDLREEPSMGQSRAALDPLAELARLVAHEDPYRNVFRPVPAVPATAETEQVWRADAEPHGYGRDDGQAGAGQGDGDADGDADGYAHDEEHGWSEHDDHPYGVEADDDEQRYYAAEHAAHRDDAGIADETLAADAAAAAIPDLWARDDGHRGAAPALDRDVSATGDRPAAGTSARRPLVALAAVLVLTGGGLAASFLAKGNGALGLTGSARSAPSIMAATGPTKVKQDDPAATAPEDQDAALLSRGPAPTSGAVKVVQSEEQPIDLGQLPRADQSRQPDSVVTASSPFPEAKKVKTFLVHPDGTMLSDNGAPVAAPPAPATPPAAVTSPDAGVPPAAPKPPARSAAAPKPATIAKLLGGDGAGDAPPVSAPPKPPKAPPPAAAGNGAFGLQLAASPSEADAHSAFAKLKKKYPEELGSLTASVHKSETGGKPVYRVRVGGMTREMAGELCGKLQAGGGSCFVVHD